MKRKWWVLFVCVLVAGLLGAAYIAYWPTAYVSKAQMWVAGKYRLREGATYDESGQNLLATQSELMQSTKIQSRAFMRLREATKVALRTNSQGHLPPVKLRVAPVQKSGVLELRAVGPDPAYVQAFLDATMAEFIAFKREVRAATAGLTYNSVSEQITRQEAELKSEQEKLNAHMRQNNVAALEEQSKAAGAFLMQLTTELSRLTMESHITDATLTNQSAGPGTHVAPARLISGVPPTETGRSNGPPLLLQPGQHELERLKIARARLSHSLRPKHPKIIKLDAQIAQAEQFIAYVGQQNREQFVNAHGNLRIQMEQVQRSIKDWEEKVNNASERLAVYYRLKDNVERAQALQQRLLSLLQNVDLSRNLEQEQIEVLDQASPAEPDKLPALNVGAMALLAGLLVGISVIFLVERLDDRIISFDDLSRRFPEWIVGQLPEVHALRKQRGPALIQKTDSLHILAESHRNIRSALLFADMSGQKPKTLLVTSAIPREGKSTVAANMARTLALAGGRVLLVDGDLRCGVLHQLFGTPRDPGFGDLLANGGDLDKSVLPTSIENLFLLPCGNALPGSSEVFLSRKFDRLLEEMRETYDCVIMDSIPIFAADDTTSVAPKMDGVLFVVRASFTGGKTARRALDLLYDRQARVLGLVFNRSNSSSRSYEYYKYANYYREKAPQAA